MVLPMQDELSKLLRLNYFKKNRNAFPVSDRLHVLTELRAQVLPLAPT